MSRINSSAVVAVLLLSRCGVCPAQPAALTSGGALAPTGNSFILGQPIIGYAAVLGGTPSITAGIVPVLLSASRCPADFNSSGTVSVQDIFDFLAAYFSNDPRADFNHSGAISVQDIFDFLAAYFTPCV